MSLTWELREYDREFFERELNGFVPDRIFDSHAHLYRIEHWGEPGRVQAGPGEVTLSVFRRQMDWIMPGRSVDGLLIGTGLDEEHYLDSNEFVAAEAAKDLNCRGELIVSPRMEADEVLESLRRTGLAGLKVYHTLVDAESTWNADIDQMLPEEHVRLADREGLCITLHIVKEGGLTDERNQEVILRYCSSYPNMKLILAHAGRGFNPYHTIEGIKALSGLRNLWFDTSAVTEQGAFEAIVETFGYERLLWGSDYPVSHFRGRCVAIGTGFVWLYEDTLDWKTVAHAEIQPLLMGLESLRVLKLAAHRLRLSDLQIEGVFWTNARKMLGFQ